MAELRSAPANLRRAQGGPPPLVPALAYGALMIASVAVSAGGPDPATPAAGALAYARTHTGQLHVVALLAFGAAVPLAGLAWIIAASTALLVSRHRIQPTSWPDSGVSEHEGTAISGNLPRHFHPAGG